MSFEETYATDGQYLKASDLVGQEIKSVIEDIGTADFEGVAKFVVTLKGQKKGLVLNKTNGMIIADLYGDDEAKWIGEKIILFPGRVNFNGKTVPCIKVRVS